MKYCSCRANISANVSLDDEFKPLGVNDGAPAPTADVGERYREADDADGVNAGAPVVAAERWVVLSAPLVIPRLRGVSNGDLRARYGIASAPSNSVT